MAKQKYWNGSAWEIVGTDADKVALKDTSNLFTATNVESALQELFTNVSNGKNSIATAITGKGVSASGSDTFTALANKIGQIVTGKKWASGTAVTDTSRKITITGLEFNPSFIIWDAPTFNRFGFFNKESNQANYLGWAISDGDNASRVYSKTGVLSVGGFSVVADSGSDRTVYWWAFE